MQAVEMFLDEKIGYLDIVKVVEDTCETHKADLMQQPSLQVRPGRMSYILYMGRSQACGRGRVQALPVSLS
jgi:hypothetical protein